MTVDLGNLLAGLGAGLAGGIAAALSFLRWREQHERPLVLVWVGHWRDNAQDAGRMVVDCTFSNRGHGRELIHLWLEVPSASAVIDYTLWKNPEMVKAGSTRRVTVALDKVRDDVGLYFPNRSERDIARALASMRVTFVTGDGDRHVKQLEKANRKRLIKWLEHRTRAR